MERPVPLCCEILSSEPSCKPATTQTKRRSGAPAARLNLRKDPNPSDPMSGTTVANILASARPPETLFEKMRRPVGWAGMVVVAALVLWASLGAASRPVPLMRLSEMGWQQYRTASLQFVRPAGWEVAPLAEGAEGFRLTPPGGADGTHIALAYLPAAAPDLRAVERLGVAHVERNEALARHYVRILPRTRMAGRAAAQVRFSGYLASGAQVEGVWSGTPLPDGRVLAVSLEVHSGTSFKSAYAVYRQVLPSVRLTP